MLCALSQLVYFGKLQNLNPSCDVKSYQHKDLSAKFRTFCQLSILREVVVQQNLTYSKSLCLFVAAVWFLYSFFLVETQRVHFVYIRALRDTWILISSCFEIESSIMCRVSTIVLVRNCCIYNI